MVPQLGARQAWWEDRQDREEEQRILAALARDFDETRENLHETMAEFEGIADTVTLLLDLIADGGPIPPQQANELLGRAFSWATFEPRLSTYSDLLGSGTLRLIRDHALRSAMAVFVADFEDAQEVVGVFRTRWTNIEEPYLTQHVVIADFWEGYGRPLRPLPFQPDSGALQSREFANLLVGRRGLIEDVMRNADAALKTLDTIDELTQASLEASRR